VDNRLKTVVERMAFVVAMPASLAPDILVGNLGPVGRMKLDHTEVGHGHIGSTVLSFMALSVLAWIAKKSLIVPAEV
jgi:hypothetical protein